MNRYVDRVFLAGPGPRFRPHRYDGVRLYREGGRHARRRGGGPMDGGSDVSDAATVVDVVTQMDLAMSDTAAPSHRAERRHGLRRCRRLPARILCTPVGWVARAPVRARA